MKLLVDDKVNSYLGDSGIEGSLGDLFRAGAKGFETMDNAELLQCAFDAGLDSRYPTIVGALAEPA